MDREIETLRELLRLLNNAPEEKPVTKTTGKGPAMILQLLSTNPGWRVPNLVKASGKSQATVERYLRQLRNQGLIEFRGAPKNGGYFVR